MEGMHTCACTCGITFFPGGALPRQSDIERMPLQIGDLGMVLKESKEDEEMQRMAAEEQQGLEQQV